MDLLALSNARLLDPEGIVPPDGQLLIAGGRIADVLAPGARLPERAQRLDLGGGSLCPGFLDLHHHGGLVLGEADAFEAALRASAASCVRHGTTGFLPTTVAWGPEVLGARIEALAALLDGRDWPGAQPLGIHVEGPWIRAEAAGAQPRAAIRAYDPREGRDVLARAAGSIRMLTLAPEIDGAPALLAEIARRGIVAALGHSLADADAIDAAVAAGLRHVTHLFNAMGPLHHREPGTAGLVLADDRVTCDLICDGVHVHPALVKLAARAKRERLLLVSDRVDTAPGDDAPGSFGSGRLRSDGTVLRLADGRLAASCLTLERAVANAQRFAGWSLREAVAACTLAPARLLGIEHERGTLRPGARADLVLLDADGNVRRTWMAGRCVHPVAGDPSAAS